MVIVINPFVSFPSGAGFDSDYQAVLDYATTQGYTLPSASQQTIQNQLVLDLKTAGAWSNIDVLYVFATDGDADFALINWKDPASLEAVNVGCTFTANEGYDGAGSSANRITTGYRPTVFLGNFVDLDCSFGTWLFDGGTVNTQYIIGDFSRNLLRADGVMRIQAPLTQVNVLPTSGWVSVERNSSTNFEFNFNGVITLDSANSTTPIDNEDFDLLNRANQNVGTDACMSFFYAGAYFGDNSVYNAVNTYMSNI